MREYQAKRRFRKLLYSKATVAVLVILTLFFAQATYGVFKKQRESAANVIAAQKRLDKVVEREAALNADINKLKTDEGIEEEIRSKFSVSKPGEEVIIIVDKEVQEQQATTTKPSFWQKIKGFFMRN